MRKVCMAMIRFYQRHISPMKRYPSCRFAPTCSSYALEAFEKRGFFAGFVLTVWRLLRCSPLSPGGYDPVPLAGFKTMPFRWSKYDRSAGFDVTVPDTNVSGNAETTTDDTTDNEPTNDLSGNN